MASGQQNFWLMAIGSAMTIVLLLIVTVMALAPMPVGPPGSVKLYHILAFAIELIQPQFAHQATWPDLLADGIGAGAGIFAALYLGSRLRRSWWKDTISDTKTDA